jgi:hypothetical protein
MEFFVIAWLAFAMGTAWLAKAKGRSFIGWLIYAVILLPITLIHALVMKNSEPHYAPISIPMSIGTAPAPVSMADELTKLADLAERGFITREEYEAQKARLLALSPGDAIIDAPSESTFRPTAA